MTSRLLPNLKSPSYLRLIFLDLNVYLHLIYGWTIWGFIRTIILNMLIVSIVNLLDRGVSYNRNQPLIDATLRRDILLLYLHIVALKLSF